MAWMKQKSELPAQSQPAREPQAPQTPRREMQMETMVNIGKSVHIKGELTGNEDLVIEGQIDGKIVLKDHQLTIGANGHVTAEINAKAVVVVGEVVGNITADDRVEVAATGSMQGDIAAPRVVLADGARFKGSIDMEPKSSMSASQPKAATAHSGTASTGSSQPGLPQSASAAK